MREKKTKDSIFELKAVTPVIIKQYTLCKLLIFVPVSQPAMMITSKCVSCQLFNVDLICRIYSVKKTAAKYLKVATNRKIVTITKSYVRKSVT